MNPDKNARIEESLEVESLTVHFIPTKEVKPNEHHSGTNSTVVKGDSHEALIELTKGRDIKVLGGIAISGKEAGRECIGEHGLGFPHGPKLRDEAVIVNPIELRLKQHGPFKPKDKDEAFKAHTNSPIKRGVSPSPHHLLKSLRSLKNRVRAQDPLGHKAEIDGTTIDNT